MTGRILLLFATGILGSCGWNAAGMTGCRLGGGPRALPHALRESSGVAWSRSHPGVLFSHNDSGHDPVVFAMDRSGLLVGEIPLAGARNRDWEDLAVGPCGAGVCVYVADIGDNQEVREDLVIYRVLDSGPFDGFPREVESFPLVLPDGPRDAESIFVLPTGEVFLVTKGRSHPVTLFRYPPPLRPGESVVLEEVQTLSEGRLPIPQQVTGADASPDGEIVVIRSYEAIYFYSWDGNRLALLEGGTVYLRTLHELQGEGVGVGPAGSLALTSEGALAEGATLSLLQCDLTRRSP